MKEMRRSLVLDIAEGRTLFGVAASTVDHFLVTKFVLSQSVFRLQPHFTVFTRSGYIKQSVAPYDAVFMLKNIASFDKVIVDLAKLLIAAVFIQVE